MPQLTARDIHSAFLASRDLLNAAPVPWGKPWERMVAKERAAYERMAVLLNEKLAPPEQLVATGKLTDVDNFIVILVVGSLEDTEQTVRLKAHDALYNSGLGDGTRDMLRGTLVIQSTHEFLCEPLPQPHSTPYKPEMEMK